MRESITDSVIMELALMLDFSLSLLLIGSLPMRPPPPFAPETESEPSYIGLINIVNNKLDTDLA